MRFVTMSVVEGPFFCSLLFVYSILHSLCPHRPLHCIFATDARLNTENLSILHDKLHQFVQVLCFIGERFFTVFRMTALFVKIP